jgi:hypothetical protein
MAITVCLVSACGYHDLDITLADFIEVADVITNYATAGIPLETMWTDIGIFSSSFTKLATELTRLKITCTNAESSLLTPCTFPCQECARLSTISARMIRDMVSPVDSLRSTC